MLGYDETYCNVEECFCWGSHRHTLHLRGLKIQFDLCERHHKLWLERKLDFRARKRSR